MSTKGKIMEETQRHEFRNISDLAFENTSFVERCIAQIDGKYCGQPREADVHVVVPAQARITETLELKPCPFCGNEVSMNGFPNGESDADYVYEVQCDRDACDVHPSAWHNTEAEAARIWNTRPDIALTTAIEAIEKRRDEWQKQADDMAYKHQRSPLLIMVTAATELISLLKSLG